ncbi:2-octaprenyl-6-methoxyphenyl hydroxylase [Agaribacterium sp. ZY112]|uniref:2-octaprenyl-6-methoxyphenyl hydroxylase n=1 Tax=Agaribacterium sp. ZY112 TaxID=3233574 RepID=UPI003524E18D
MNSKQQYDIAIIGAGMVGLSQALLLNRALPDKRIVVLEARSIRQGDPSPSFDDRVTALAAGSIKLLNELGLWAELQSATQDISHVKVSDRGHFGAINIAQEQNAGSALGCTLSNRVLGKVLMQAVESCEHIDLHAPAAVKSVSFATDKVSVTYGSEQTEATLTAALLLIADGAESAIAKRLGISFESHDYQQRALIANVEHQRAHQGHAFERFAEEGPLALLPLAPIHGRQRSALVWTRKPNQADLLEQCSEAEFLAALQKQFGWSLGRFCAVGERQSYKLQLINANEQWRSRLVLLGNAAHFLHPVAGQGFNLALRDCERLALVLAEQGGDLGALSGLNTYGQQRSNDQWLTTALSHQAISCFASSFVPMQLARNLALSSLNHVTALKSLFSSQMMGQATNHKGLRI